MKHISLLVFVVWLSGLAVGEDGYDDHQLHLQDGAKKISCRVAVCLSGHVRSFVSPAVHLSLRRNLIEAIEKGGCRVDVFAYAALEDAANTLVEQVSNYRWASWRQ